MRALSLCAYIKTGHGEGQKGREMKLLIIAIAVFFAGDANAHHEGLISTIPLLSMFAYWVYAFIACVAWVALDYFKKNF